MSDVTWERHNFKQSILIKMQTETQQQPLHTYRTGGLSHIKIYLTVVLNSLQLILNILNATRNS